MTMQRKISSPYVLHVTDERIYDNLTPIHSKLLAKCHFIMRDVTRNYQYYQLVIVSCRDKRTRDFGAGKRVKAFSGFERSARLKLDRLEAATSL